MKSMDLNANWKVVSNEGEFLCDLPYDAMINAQKDYACPLGELSGYYPAQKATFTRSLPAVRCNAATLVIKGACGYGDVFVNDRLVGTLTGRAPAAFDVTELVGGTHGNIRIEMTSVPGMSDKYIGLGIGGGVELITENALDIENGSLFVRTSTSGERTYADVDVCIHNYGPAVKLMLECTALSARGKRAGKKQRKIFMRANTGKVFSVRVRINNAYEWSTTDPYMYTMTAKLVGCEGEPSATTRFGIVSRAFNQQRGIYLNGKNVKLFGAYVSHADAILGGVSNYSNEKRRFEALKSIGYNAVHFVECPSDAALDALDDVGMYAFVDIYGQLLEGKAPLDSHLFGLGAVDVLSSVNALKNHPSVALYGVADDVPECYGRHDGHELIAGIANEIRALDSSRPVTVSSREFVPTHAELEKAGIKRKPESDIAAINAGREKDLFGTMTEGAFAAVDVCGFNYLDPLYSTEAQKRDRFIVGARTSSERALECYEETEKNVRVIGDFCDCGIDYPGGGTLNQNHTSFGDLDAVCDPTPASVLRRILLGERNVAYIAVLDPDTNEPVPMWNWPRSLGQPVTVKVYTSCDVVALYLDGRLIGRKLAGKVNRHVATFTTDFYPGTLEAICYFKGVECARAKLKSAASPKTIKLFSCDKNLSVSRGDLGFVHIDVCDRDGNVVPYAMRELTANVTGGTLVGFINADPLLRKHDFDVCPAYNGKALCVIKPDPAEERAVVKITGDGLLAARITFKIKN